MLQIALLLLEAIAVIAQSPYYDIPAYYGHFSLNFFEPAALAKGKFAELEYHFAADASYDGETIYFAHEAQHCIYSYSNTTGQVTSFAGNCGTSGNIIGSIQNAEFNGVSSIAYFRTPSSTLLNALESRSLYIVANSSCAIDTEGCVLSQPYPTLSVENLQLWPDVSLYEDEQGQEEYLYVADTGNHCIKRITIASMEITIVAGRCQSSGFLDGPMGYNRLNSPRNLGISRSGTLYFFDSGNEYLRILTPDGSVSTLLLGACKDRGVSRVIQGYELRKIICYENWIQYDTQNPINHYFDPSTLNVCTLQASQCENLANKKISFKD